MSIFGWFKGEYSAEARHERREVRYNVGEMSPAEERKFERDAKREEEKGYRAFERQSQRDADRSARQFERELNGEKTPWWDRD